MGKFNLIDKPWIPVLKDGRVQEVSLREALTDRSLGPVDTPSPLEEASIYRLLLAILHRALGGPEDLYQVLEWLEGSFPQQLIDDYLDQFKHRFYLFDDVAPFLQVPDLPREDPLPWTKLLPERASGNNPTLFDHSMDDSPTLLTYPEAARALLVHQAFTTVGLLRRLGVASAQGGPLAVAAVFIAVGETLWETLLLNLVPYRPEGDEAIWEVEPLKAKDLEGYRTVWPLSGLARTYVWPARGVLLLDEGNGVRHMAYGPGVKPKEAGFRDPMVAYKEGGQGGRRVFQPLRLSVEKAFWRDFNAMLPAKAGAFPAVLDHALKVEMNGGPKARFRVLGQVADQAKIFDVRREVYPLPPSLLEPEVQLDLDFALERAERVGQGLKRVARRLAQEVLGEWLKKRNRRPAQKKEKEQEEEKKFANSLPLERLYWHQLDLNFLLFLERLGSPEARGFWKEALAQAVQEAWKATRLHLGTQGRHLKALSLGEKEIGFIIKEARE